MAKGATWLKGVGSDDIDESSISKDISYLNDKMDTIASLTEPEDLHLYLLAKMMMAFGVVHRRIH
ncbi:hypothetical protein EGR_08268 [Echinococcus granulosus]|uniref:Uncharacterized protein n=1 Tax=Echinococcus granulosus TaxID=6210 RepID=W6UFE5_ECHGR|nr:hypothetical protein EGR_08268 [Echinococcus granulosus]EUB56862.1 hypothetical protein EGR_08268 [Echinococcus granulosus]